METQKPKKSKPKGFAVDDETIQDDALIEDVIEEVELEEVIEIQEEPPQVKQPQHYREIRPMSRNKSVPVRGKKSATNFSI